jgi:hypothetical protein
MAVEFSDNIDTFLHSNYNKLTSEGKVALKGGGVLAASIYAMTPKRNFDSGEILELKKMVASNKSLPPIAGAFALLVGAGLIEARRRYRKKRDHEKKVEAMYNQDAFNL